MIKRAILCMALIVIIGFVSHAGEVPPTYVLNYKTFSEAGTSTIPGYARDMAIDNLGDKFRHVSWNALCAGYNDFNQAEIDYYFKKEHTDAIKTYDTETEFMCLAEVYAEANLKIDHYSGNDQYNDYNVVYDLLFSFDHETSSSDIDFSVEGSYKWGQPYNGKFGYTSTHYLNTVDSKTINNVTIYDADNGNPITYNKLFTRTPAESNDGVYHSLSYIRYPTNWHKDLNKASNVAQLVNRKSWYKMLPAVEPKLQLHNINQEVDSTYFFYTTEKEAALKVNYPITHSMPEFIVDSEIDNLGVKIISLDIYKKDTISGYKRHRFLQEAIDPLNPESLKEARFGSASHYIAPDAGMYMVVISCVDLFNKIYVYEPVYFAVDYTPPVVDEVVIESEKYHNDDITIASFKFTDDYTVYTPENVGQYVFINLGGEIKSINEHNTNGTIFNTTYYNKRLSIDLVKEAQIDYQLRGITVQDQFKLTAEVPGSVNDYYLDKTAPAAVLTSNQAVYTWHDGRHDSIEITIDDASATEILSCAYEVAGQYYDLMNRVSQPSAKKLIMPVQYLTVMQNKESPVTLSLLVKDVCDNYNVIDHLVTPYGQSYSIHIDRKEPVVEVLVNGTAIQDGEYRNNAQNLVVSVTDTYFEYYDVMVESSNAAMSSNDFTEHVTTAGTQTTGTFNLSPGVAGEKLIVTVDGYDKAGQHVETSGYFYLYNDTAKPAITRTGMSTDDSYNDVYDVRITDDTSLKGIWRKDIYVGNNSVTQADFGSFSNAPGSGWLMVSPTNLIDRSYLEQEQCDTRVTIAPGFAACLYTIDHWGNTSYWFKSKSLYEGNYTEITGKADLDPYKRVGGDGKTYYDLYGRFLFRLNDGNGTLEILPDEIVTIFTVDGKKTELYFHGTGNLPAIVNKGGTIIIKADKSPVELKGIPAISKKYSWQGIIIESGELFLTDNVHGITLKNAKAGFTFNQPDHSISLTNITIEDCFTGIHFYDRSAVYHSLNLTDATFSRLVYGIKLEIDTYEEADLSGVIPSQKVTLNGGSFIDMYKGQIYCPVNGIK